MGDRRDLLPYLLKALSWTGLAWDLKTPPAAVRLNEYRLGSRVIERAAAHLAGALALSTFTAATALLSMAVA